MGSESYFLRFRNLSRDWILPLPIACRASHVRLIANSCPVLTLWACIFNVFLLAHVRSCAYSCEWSEFFHVLNTVSPLLSKMSHQLQFLWSKFERSKHGFCTLDMVVNELVANEISNKAFQTPISSLRQQRSFSRLWQHYFRREKLEFIIVIYFISWVYINDIQYISK